MYYVGSMLGWHSNPPTHPPPTRQWVAHGCAQLPGDESLRLERASRASLHTAGTMRVGMLTTWKPGRVSHVPLHIALRMNKHNARWNAIEVGTTAHLSRIAAYGCALRATGRRSDLGALVTHRGIRRQYNGYIAGGMSFIRSMRVTFRCTALL